MTAVVEQSPASLSELSDAELLDLYRNGDYDAALTEAKRRDNRDDGTRKRAAERAEWHDMAYAQYLAAEAACKGNLVARNSTIGDGWALWTGPEQWALKHASEELRNFWLDNPRITVSAYRAQLADSRRSIRHEIERESYDGRMVKDGPGEIQPETKADTNGHAVDGGIRDSSGPGCRPNGDAGPLGAYPPGFLLKLRAALADSIQRYAA